MVIRRSSPAYLILPHANRSSCEERDHLRNPLFVVHATQVTQVAQTRYMACQFLIMVSDKVEMCLCLLTPSVLDMAYQHTNFTKSIFDRASRSF